MELAFLNIGTQEMFIIVIVILLLFGGKKLPELARGLGRGIREFKDASEGIKQEIAEQINNFEKDLDVTVADKKNDPSTPADEEYANEVEGTIPQFSTPENTFEHDPGAHPVDETEYYKYGYNDHFATDQTEAASEEQVKNTETENNNPAKPA